IASVPDLVLWARQQRKFSLTTITERITRREAAVTLGVLVALVAVTRPAVVHARDALRAASHHPATSTPPAVSLPPRGWRLDGSLPTDWQRLAGSSVTRRGHAVSFHTRPSVGAYETWSPGVELAPGAYDVVLEGTVDAGGMTLGAIDVKTQAWLGRTRSSAGR